MTPRPLHKWKTLWLGLLILAFLTWAWARSRNHSNGIGYHLAPNVFYGVSSDGSYLWWDYNTHRYYPRTHGRITWGKAISNITEPWFGRPFKQEKGMNSSFRGSYISHGIAYWLFILLFILTWSLLLTLRWLHLKRLSRHKHLPSEDPAAP